MQQPETSPKWACRSNYWNFFSEFGSTSKCGFKSFNMWTKVEGLTPHGENWNWFKYDQRRAFESEHSGEEVSIEPVQLRPLSFSLWPLQFCFQSHSNFQNVMELWFLTTWFFSIYYRTSSMRSCCLFLLLVWWSKGKILHDIKPTLLTGHIHWCTSIPIPDLRACTISYQELHKI